MFYINGESILGLEDSNLVFFGDATVTGRAEIAESHRHLNEGRFWDGEVIPIIGQEYMVRTGNFAPKESPDLFDNVRGLQPPGLITFGVSTEQAANSKGSGTHMEIFLREWGIGNGPIVPFLGVSIEGVYYEKRTLALAEITRLIGKQEITMSRVDEELHISL